MALENLTFDYEGIKFQIEAKAIGRRSGFLYSVPMTVIFPSGQTIKQGKGFDIDKGIFLGFLVEDHDMRKYFPEIIGEAPDLSYYKRWDEHRVKMSEVFNCLFLEKKIKLEYVKRRR